MIITSFICPNRTFANLSFPPPVPLDLDGPYAIATRPDLCIPQSTGSGYPLAFPAAIHSCLHRNWKPYSWDFVGEAVGRFEAVGVALVPGLVGGGDTNYEFNERSITAEFPGSDLEPTAPQPNFAIETEVRTMVAWDGLGDGFSPYVEEVIFDEFYPLFWDENGDNLSGWYVIGEFKAFAVLEPYYWVRDGNYYLEQEIRMDVRIYCTPAPGLQPPEGWDSAEGASFRSFENSSTSRNTRGDREAAGVARILDTTGIDPNTNWGSVVMWGRADCPIDITLRVRSNFLPFPE